MSAVELVRVEGLAKHYPGGRGVSEACLHLESGEILGFIGPNGAGKTTTLRMLAGLLRPDAGSGQVAGRDIAHATAGSERVGYMPQKLALYSELTVEDNLRFRAEVYCLNDPAVQVRRVLETFGLHARRTQLAGELSGGWARRLQLAAALIHGPDLVLLDEPTAGLDSESREEVWRRIQGLAEGGAGIIINTHDLLEAERCSRVALFRTGRIRQQGSPAELCEAAPLRAALVDPTDRAKLQAALKDIDALACEPHGRRWRVLTTMENFAMARSTCVAAGATVDVVDTRLSDVVLLDEGERLPEDMP